MAQTQKKTERPQIRSNMPLAQTTEGEKKQKTNKMKQSNMIQKVYKNIIELVLVLVGHLLLGMGPALQ